MNTYSGLTEVTQILDDPDSETGINLINCANASLKMMYIASLMLHSVRMPPEKNSDKR